MAKELPTLGGAVGAWIEAHVAIGDGEQAGEPYLLTTEMWRFLAHFYAIDPETGRFLYHRGAQLVRPQKWGKSPFAAAIVCAEAAGPVRFDCWDASGQPTGRPVPTPLIQVCASTEDQAGNTWRALLPMIQLGDIAHELTDTGETRVNLPSGGRIEPATSAHRSRHGARLTFCVMDEPHSWLHSNGGRQLADTLRRNLAGMGGRWLATTNAWDPAEESVAQQTAEADEPGVFLDDAEPGEGSARNKAERRRMLRAVYGDSAAGCAAQGGGRIAPWVDLARIDSEIIALLDRDAAQAERFFLNRKRAREASAFDPKRIDELADPTYSPKPRALIVVGVDGARFVDALAIVATEVATGFQWPLGIWTRPENAPDDYEHDFHAADGAMVDASERFRIWRIYVDPQYVDILVEKWQGRWGGKKVLPWHTNRPAPIAHAVRRYAEAIAAGDLSHDGDATLVRHIKNAVRRPVSVRDDEGRPLFTLGKDGRNSPRKIDGAMAAVLSWEARHDARLDGKGTGRAAQLITFGGAESW